MHAQGLVCHTLVVSRSHRGFQLLQHQTVCANHMRLTHPAACACVHVCMRARAPRAACSTLRPKHSPSRMRGINKPGGGLPVDDEGRTADHDEHQRELLIVLVRRQAHRCAAQQVLLRKQEQRDCRILLRYLLQQGSACTFEGWPAIIPCSFMHTCCCHTWGLLGGALRLCWRALWLRTYLQTVQLQICSAGTCVHAMSLSSLGWGGGLSPARQHYTPVTTSCMALRRRANAQAPRVCTGTIICGHNNRCPFARFAPCLFACRLSGLHIGFGA